MKKLFYLLIVFGLLMFVPKQSFAQDPPPQPFAGGEINLTYVGPANAACGTGKQYEISLKFYRDCGGSASSFPAAPRVWAYNRLIFNSTNNEGLIPVTMGNPVYRGEIPNLCVQGNPICTDGQWYTGNVTLAESVEPWQIEFGWSGEIAASNGDRVFARVGNLVHSADHTNIDEGQRFRMRTEVLVRCQEIQTGANDKPANTFFKSNTFDNEAASWSTYNKDINTCNGIEPIATDVVETYCNGKTYEVQLPVFDNDFVNKGVDLNEDGVIDATEKIGRDSIAYSLSSPVHGSGDDVFFTTPFAYDVPFPLSPFSKLDLNPTTGILTFTPELRKGENSFFATLAISIEEWKNELYVDVVNLGGGGTQNVIRSRKVNVHTSTRQMRIVIDRKCDRNLPEFESDSWNATEEAWEFGCASKELKFKMDKPMLFNSLAGDEFDMFRGAPNGTVDDNAIIIEDVTVEECNINALGEFSEFTVHLLEPIGPGNYVLFPKYGEIEKNNPNTITNRCGFEIPQLTEIPVYIRTDPFVFDYKDNDEPISICYPQDPIQFFPLRGQDYGTNAEFLFTYEYTNFGPSKKDSVYAKYVDPFSPENSFREEIEEDINGDPIFKDGEWTIGLGIVYTHTYNGEYFRNVCYDEDKVIVETFQNKDIVPRDWDLCPEEDWPIINLDTVTMFHNAQDFIWEVEGRVTDANGDLVRNENGGFKKGWFSAGGSSSETEKNDKFPISSVAFGQGEAFRIRSIVQLEEGECFDTSIYLAQKSRVEVEIGSDSIICPGEQYTLQNSVTYINPDSMYYQFYHNGVLVGDTNYLKIDEEGIYKLITFKRSEWDENGDRVICMGEDSVRIVIADSLYPPEPECSKVTYQDGSVRQLFFWPEVIGADGYQIKTVDFNGVVSEEWEEANNNEEGSWFSSSGTYNQLHSTSGQEIKLIVRAYNLEVDEDAICRYGPESLIAKSCEIVVKPVNIFTPNGDGVNDKLKFDLLEVYEGNELQIFNRWGELIYESSNYQNEWDGDGYNEGTYFYILNVNDPQGTNSLIKGAVTIVR